jgi:predicted dehydrogenase
MKASFTRRDFIKSTSAAGIGLSLPYPALAKHWKEGTAEQNRVGIIGLDTSHSVAFTKLLNAPDAGADLGGYRVVAAYPKGSPDIESSVSRVPGYIEEVKKLGVQLVPSIADLLKKVDVVLLETNDGRPHFEQAMPVLKAGKRLFIDKPVAASLAQVVAIYEAAQQYKVPVFSSSSLRYMVSAQEVVSGKVGKVLGADAYSPAHLEKTHPDLFWYGIHGVETLYTVMGPGCKSVVRVHTENTDLVVGTWEDGRVGTFRGTRSGKSEYGGTAFGENGTALLGPYDGYRPLLVQIVQFFQTGIPPVSPTETMEIYAFMEAADESKRQGGVPVTLKGVLASAQKVKE